jgi:hypothetical protein
MGSYPAHALVFNASLIPRIKAKFKRDVFHSICKREESLASTQLTVALRELQCLMLCMIEAHLTVAPVCRIVIYENKPLKTFAAGWQPALYH